jgi:arylsulfatase
MTIVTEFEQSLKRYPPIAPGTPDPYIPALSTLNMLSGQSGHR